MNSLCDAIAFLRDGTGRGRPTTRRLDVAAAFAQPSAIESLGALPMIVFTATDQPGVVTEAITRLLS